MNTKLCLAMCLCFAPFVSAQSLQPAPANPEIDMAGFLNAAHAAADHRSTRRLSEGDFERLSRDPATVVLDARSKEKYDLLHLRGAINLSFPDITVASLNELLPDKNTRILIYCNNNFAKAERPFPSKRADASLNLSTYIALYSYGYRNIYELGPLLDLDSTQLELVASTDGTRQAGNAAPR